MTSEGTFLKRLGIASAVITGLGLWPLLQAAKQDSDVIIAAIVGFLLSAGNVLGGYAAIVYGRKKGPQLLNVIVFASMTVRMLLMLALIIVSVRVFALPAITLVVSLFAFYLTFLVIEVQFLWSTSRNV